MSLPLDLADLTSALIAIPSESLSELAIADIVEAELRGVSGLEITRIANNVVARTTGDRLQRVLFAGHLDTVPANDNEKPRVEGDTLYGLGGTDMKSGLAVMINLAKQATSFVHESTYAFYAAEEIARAKSGLLEIHSALPHLLEADIAILGEPTDAKVELGCQGTMRFQILVRGERAHTARPWMGRNAIHRCAQVLQALSAYPERRVKIDGCEFREALQAVKIEGGVAGNVVPDEVRIVVNHRFAPDRSDDEAFNAVGAFVEAFLEPTDSIVLTESAPAALPFASHPLLVDLIAASGEEPSAKLGWTDVAFFAELGVPAANFGPGDATLAHTADESVSIAAIHRTYDTLNAWMTK